MKHKIASDAAIQKNKNAKRGYLSQVINDVRKKRRIGYVNIPLQIIHVHHSPDLVFPLLKIKDTVVEFVIEMAEICHSFTPSRCLDLVNSLISGTSIQN